jgi:tetratricopeptide (TPR) repeat protein
MAAIALLLTAATLAVYLQVGQHQFVGLDDGPYVTRNLHVAGGITAGNVFWAFTSLNYFYWQPVTWLSHMADVQLFGLNPGAHHLVNVVFHLANTVLLLVLLNRLTGSVWRSSFVAAVFALHPLHVESVAWIAERKDVLSAFFGFLALICYGRYAASGKRSAYLLTLGAFVLGLMSKPMLVTLPLLMLLLDLWPLERYAQGAGWRDRLRRGSALVLEKLPFFICSLLAGLVTFYGQYKFGAVRELGEIPLRVRLENVPISYATYILKTLWPQDLALLYPYPMSVPLGQLAGALALLAAGTVAVLRHLRHRPYLAVGWFWFLITLLPVIGLTAVGTSAIADRFTYIPMIGLSIMVAWWIPETLAGVPARHVFLGLMGGVSMVALGVLSWQQVGYWRDSVTIFQHTLQVTSDNYMINNNLGLALAQKGEFEAAIDQYQQALKIKPDDENLHDNLGIVLEQKGDIDSAIRQYQLALQLNSLDENAHFNLGLALARKGDLNGAIEQFLVSLRLKPDDADANKNLALLLVRKRTLDQTARAGKKAP